MSAPAPDGPVKIVRCPACGGRSVYATSNPFRPFCSDRCKSMDFGAWASEGFKLPEQPLDSDPEFQPR
ncbi:MAG: DNA gyrase inhibitor YacG [Hydrogenophaga sp.]|jgi:hypothetical protein|nr:DNA gyrase inhibitor YacG [Hydrogenophaga sp.]